MIRRPFMTVLAFSLAANCATAAPTQALGTQEDEASIRTVIVQMTDAFNKHDAKASTRMYTSDADLVTVRGESFRGTSAYEAGLASIFATRAKEATLRTIDVTVRFIRTDVAIAQVTNELSGLIAADGQRPPPHKELSMRVFVKESGIWRVAAFHNTLLQPFGSATQR